MLPAEDAARAAAILDRKARGMLALDEAVVELADANCIVTIAIVIAERLRVQPDMVANSLAADSDESISVLCRAGGFSLNGFSAILRMRRRRNHGSASAAEALAHFSGLNRAEAEGILQEIAPRPRAVRRFRRADR
jgi:hypothetical protein